VVEGKQMALIYGVGIVYAPGFRREWRLPLFCSRVQETLDAFASIEDGDHPYNRGIFANLRGNKNDDR